MRRVYWTALLSATAILALLVKPAIAAQGGTVVASAVIVPAQKSEMAFLSSAHVKEVTVKEGDEVTLGQTLVVLSVPEMEYGVSVSEAVLRSAQANAEIQKYRRVKDRRNGRVFFDVVPPEVRQKADAEVVSAQAALEIAQATLAQSVLVAPYDAIVASVNVVPGEYVQQNQVVLTLATLNNLQIETTDLSERDITKVNVGDSATIFIEALDANANGKVIAISPRADIVGGDVVFKVTIALAEQLDGLLWGMTAEVNITDE